MSGLFDVLRYAWNMQSLQELFAEVCGKECDGAAAQPAGAYYAIRQADGEAMIYLLPVLALGGRAIHHD